VIERVAGTAAPVLITARLAPARAWSLRSCDLRRKRRGLDHLGTAA